MSESEIDERVKYSISIEMELPSYESTRYLPDSLVVRFDRKNEPTEEVTQDRFEQTVRIDDKIQNNKIGSDRKLRLFIDIFYALASEDRYDVQKKILIDELVGTGHFTEQEAHAYIKKAQNCGFILERRISMYSVA